MTEQEMVVYFVERYNLSSNVNDDKEDDEIYLLLNASVNRFIKQRFTGNNTRGIPFEGDQKRKDDLRTLIKTSSELTSVGTVDEIPNGKLYTVPTDFMFLIKGYYKIGSDWYSCESINSEESYRWIQTPINLPIIQRGKIFYNDSSNFIVLVDPDNYATLTKSKIEYLKEPVVISSGVDCDLPNHTHEEIVEIALSLAIDELENQVRFQTQSETLKTVE